MSKIEKLTAKQERALVAFREEYLQIGLCCDPADRATAERTISSMYQRLGKPAPRYWWCPSPAIAMLAITVLNNNKNKDNLLWANLSANLWANLSANLRDNLRANLSDNLRANLSDNLRANLSDNLRDNLSDNLRTDLSDDLWANLSANLRTDLSDDLAWAYFWGAHEVSWIAYYRFPEQHLGVTYKPRDSELLALWDGLARSAGWWWPFQGVCFITERHRMISRDEQGRLHNLTGPALGFEDGYSLHAVHGVRVPADVIEKPESLTKERILGEQNAEVRRVMIDRVGNERFLEMVGAQPISQQQDSRGLPVTLYKIDLPDDEPMVAVQYRNWTPEPDGTLKLYTTRVPVAMTEALAALAWTFPLPAGIKYAPAIET